MPAFRTTPLAHRLPLLRNFAVVAIVAACTSTSVASPATSPASPATPSSAVASPTVTAASSPATPSAPPTATAAPATSAPATSAPATSAPTASPSPTPSATAATPTTSPTAQPGGGSHLDEALAFAPAQTRSFAFADWSRIKASRGVRDLSSRDPLDARIAFLRSIGTTEAAPVGFGLRYLRRHAETWGWDTTDLEWEALIDDPDAPPSYVARFPAGTSLAPVVAAYDRFEFTRSTHQGVTIHSSAQGLRGPWIGTTELAVRNTAVIADPPTLVMSTSLERVQALLDAGMNDGESLGRVPAVTDAATLLGDASAVFLFPPPTACAQAGAVRGDGAATFGRYDAFAVGYRRSGEAPAQGSIVMRYPSDAEATADLAAREQAARTGASVVRQQPYAEAIFTVEEARADASSVVLDVLPVDDRPRRLFDLVIQRDTGFAACG